MTKRLIAAMVLLLAPVSGWAAPAFDAATEVTGAGDLSFTHTPTGTPRGVIVYVVDSTATVDHIDGATYGGVAMTECGGSPHIYTLSENAVVYCYFLGTNVAAGAQTVAVDTNAAGNYWACAMTVTADKDLEVVDSDGTLESATYTNQTVTLSLGGRTSFASIGLVSGFNNIASFSPRSGWTTRQEVAFGGEGGSCDTYDTVGTTDVDAGWSQASEDGAAIALAVAEVTQAPRSMHQFRLRRD